MDESAKGGGVGVDLCSGNFLGLDGLGSTVMMTKEKFEGVLRWRNDESEVDMEVAKKIDRWEQEGGLSNV